MIEHKSLIRPDAINELVTTARACPPGDLVEVGVYRGGSAAYLAMVAREQGRRLFLFDTFAGTPNAIAGVDAHDVGDFSDTSVEAVRAAVPEAVCIPGVFPGTLTDDVGPIALAHVDCDQFDGVRACSPNSAGAWSRAALWCSTITTCSQVRGLRSTRFSRVASK